MADSSTNSERLFALTCALLVTKIGLTKREILTAIPAYGFVEGTKVIDEKTNKKFERDKTALRAAGVNIITENYGDPENNQDLRYRISSDHFAWPKDLHFSAREISLLTLAAKAWTGATLQESANQGLWRLRVLGEAPESLDQLALLPSISVKHRLFAAMDQAIADRTEVSFVYRKEGFDPETKTVQPWALQNIYGQWMLIGFSTKDNATRRYLLKRIQSRAIKTTGNVFEAPTKDQIDAAERELLDFEKSQVAEIRIEPNTSAWTHFRMDEPGSPLDGILRMNFIDAHVLADELRQFGTDVEILRPTALIEAHAGGLRKLLEDHHG